MCYIVVENDFKCTSLKFVPVTFAAVIGQNKLLPPEKMKHGIKLVDDQMNWCDSAMEVRETDTI